MKTVPLVLESQLYQKLENPREGDSILTKELLNLIHTNQLRRMVSTDATLVALIHTRDYVRAVWDAHHACCNADAGGPISQSLRDITPWFLASLSKWTTPTISRVEMSHLWKSSAKHLSQAIDILVMKMGVLMATNEPNIFMFWLPNWGIVLQAINKAQKSILMRIKRSAYKEISEQSIRNLSLPGGISAFFVVQTLIAIGTIQIYEKPVGTFIRLTK